MRPALLPGILAILALGLAAGCTMYQPQPLDSGEEWRRIEAVRLEDLAASPDDPATGARGAPPFDYSDGLSADEAAGLAVAMNPALRSYRLAQGIAEGQLIGAGVLPNPVIDTKWLVPTNGASWTGEVNAAFDLTKALLVRGVEKERARIRVEEVRWEIADREWQVAASARQAHIDLIYRDEVIALHALRKQIKERTLAGVKEREARGASSALDTLVSEGDLADLGRQGMRLAGERRKALERLNLILGLPPRHETRLEKPGQPLAYRPVEERPEDLLEELRRRRPDLLAAAEAHRGAEKELEAACRRQFPSIRLGPSLERGSGDLLLGLNAGLELPIFDRNAGEIAVRQAEREQKRLAYAGRLQDARAELHLAWAELEALDQELKFYFAEVAPRLDRTLDLTQRAFQAGELTLLEVLQVEERLLETKVDVLKSLHQFALAKAEVDRAAGPPPPRAD